MKKTAFAKTPEWASTKCGVPPWTIKALARDWAKKAVTIGHYFGGGMARGPYSTEPARLEVVLLGMQGLGKPGVHQAQIAYTGMPKNIITGGADHMGPFANLTATPAGDRLLKPHKGTPTAWGKQMVPKTLIEDAIKHGKVDFWGTGGHEEPTSNQYQKYSYPIPKEEGGTEFHMMWTDSPCRTTCWNCGNDVAEATRDPKIEFVVAQHPWLENDCIYADIVLPVSTTLEVDDISPCIREGDSFQSVILMRQAMEPVGESKSDYEAVVEIAKKLGMERGRHRGLLDGRPDRGHLQGHEVRRRHRLGRVPGEGLLRAAGGPGLGEVAGRVVRVLQGSGGPSAADAYRQARVLLGEPGQGVPHGRRAAAVSASGSRRASRTTSGSPASGRWPIRCWSCPTTAAGGCTPSATTSPGPEKR